jgi:hypothetical protein
MVMVPVVEQLPAGFDVLRRNARAEGHRNMDRLAEDWSSGAQRFDAAGEALLAALVAGELACVGGVTTDPRRVRCACGGSMSVPCSAGVVSAGGLRRC